MESAEPRSTPKILVALAWIVVGLPMIWGVYTSITKSLPLFQMSSQLNRKP